MGLLREWNIQFRTNYSNRWGGQGAAADPAGSHREISYTDSAEPPPIYLIDVCEDDIFIGGLSTFIFIQKNKLQTKPQTKY